jgi:hypothetical protein
MILTRLVHDTRQRAERGSRRRGRTEATPSVRRRSRWFELRQTRWGFEPHRVADQARGEKQIAGQLSDSCTHRLTTAAAARQMRSPQAFRARSHLKLPVHLFKSLQTRSVWCRSQPLAPGTRVVRSSCPWHHGPSCLHMGNSAHLWEIQLAARRVMHTNEVLLSQV